MHLGDEQLEREQHSVVAEVEREALDELAPRHGGVYEREQELHGARGGEGRGGRQCRGTGSVLRWGLEIC